MSDKKKPMEKDKMNEHIDTAMGVMQNYGFIGLTRPLLVKDASAMRFFKGVLRQHGLTEGEIEEVVDFLEVNTAV